MARAKGDMTHTLPHPSLAHVAGSTPKFDALMVLCGPAARGSSLSLLGRPPGLLPIDLEARSNVQRIIESALPFLSNHDDGESVSVLVESDADVTEWPSLQSGGRYVRDRSEFRGTAGVLRDACESLPGDSRVLVLSAGEMLETDLVPIVARIGEVDSDIVLCRDARHRPISIWSLRARCLHQVSQVGYADWKEQVLSALTSRCDVRVVTLPGESPRNHWLRDVGGYLGCVHATAGSRSSPWQVKEAQVEVANDALIVDSVLLKGARVESGAIVARSVIGPGVVVRSGRKVIDQVLSNNS